jgi:flagellar motor switch protein FliN/FliY
VKLGSVKDVMVPVQVVLGDAEISVEQLATLGEGSIIRLQALAGEPVDLVAAGKPVAKGEVVVIDENFGIRVTEILSADPNQR